MLLRETLGVYLSQFHYEESFLILKNNLPDIDITIEDLRCTDLQGKFQ